MVFFVGAGVSMAGNTGMPSTPSLIYHLLTDSLVYSGAFDTELDSYTALLKTLSGKLGFEITLNDFWQICSCATSNLYLSFAELENKCKPNCAHTFLAHWLATKGSVVTTNYDRMIEREWEKISKPIKCCYQDKGTNSFANWHEDLQKGACLFKIHGSLDNPDSCLGALEHVRTMLVGSRAELLVNIMQNRPLCFVGWRGIDPDIPPLLSSAMNDRNPSLPIFWIHYEGNHPGSRPLDLCLEEMPSLIRPLANKNPISTDADRAFGEMLQWLGINREPNYSREPFSFDFQKAVGQCAKTGVTRMVGIALRRSEKLNIARHVLHAALRLAETPEERSAALEELSLLSYVEGKTSEARKWLSRARKVIGEKSDGRPDFGVLSQTIAALNHRPWLIFVVPKQLRQYRRDLEIFRKRSMDIKSVALYFSLYQLCRGRLRFKLLRWLGRYVPPLVEWIMRPFDIAQSTIGDATDIHLHSRIDVLASRAVALAYFLRCEDAREDVLEIDRLIAILNDSAREDYWKSQRREIEGRCGIR